MRAGRRTGIGQRSAMGGMTGGFAGPQSGRMFAGGQGGRSGAAQAADRFLRPATDPSATTASAPAPAPAVVTGDTYANVAAGLASLDFRLPERGRVYSFTTQRGLIDVTARPVAHTLIGRLIGLAALIAAVLIVCGRQPRTGPRCLCPALQHACPAACSWPSSDS